MTKDRLGALKQAQSEDEPVGARAQQFLSLLEVKQDHFSKLKLPYKVETIHVHMKFVDHSWGHNKPRVISLESFCLNWSLLKMQIFMIYVE